MSYQLDPFADINLSEALLRLLIEEHEERTLPACERLLSYYRNEEEPIPGFGGVVNWRAAQVAGLPDRLTRPIEGAPPKVSWPASTIVARAYLDQLVRSNTIPAARAEAIRTTLTNADGVRTSRDRGAAEVVGALTSLASDLERDAAAATGRDASRLRAMAETVKGRADQLR